MAGLTVKSIEAAKPRAARYELADGKAPGLFLVVHPSGGKSWALRYRSPTRLDKTGNRAAAKLTLGPVAPDARGAAGAVIGQPLTLTQARALAAKAQDEIRRGIDPAAARREVKRAQKLSAENTIDAAMIEFLNRYKGKDKKGIRESTRLLTAIYFGLRRDPDKAGGWSLTGKGVLKHWSGRGLNSITKRDAISLLHQIADSGRGVTANRTLTTLKTFFAWCIRYDIGDLTVSPVAVLEAVSQESERERILTAAELVAVWRAADAVGYPYGPLVKIAILTGARRDELRCAITNEFSLEPVTLTLENGARWEGPLWTLPAERSKNGNKHLLPLSSQVVRELQSLPSIGGKGLLFTSNGRAPIGGLSQYKRQLDSAVLSELRKVDPEAVLAPWTLHDLRRTFFSGLQALGFPIEVADACVNHSSSIRGAARHYAMHKYLAEKTAALQRWADYVEALLSDTTNPHHISDQPTEIT